MHRNLTHKLCSPNGERLKLVVFPLVSCSSSGDDGWSVISTTTAGKSLPSNVKIDSYSRMYLYQTIPSTIFSTCPPLGLPLLGRLSILDSYSSGQSGTEDREPAEESYL